jgi:hypothetical protein
MSLFLYEHKSYKHLQHLYQRLPELSEKTGSLQIGIELPYDYAAGLS